MFFHHNKLYDDGTKYGLSQHFSATIISISCPGLSRMCFSEWPDPSYLDYWPFGILAERKILRIPLTNNNNSNNGNASIHFYSGHHWILRASAWCLDSFNKTIFTAQGKKGHSQMRTPVISLAFTSAFSMHADFQDKQDGHHIMQVRTEPFESCPQEADPSFDFEREVSDFVDTAAKIQELGHLCAPGIRYTDTRTGPSVCPLDIRYRIQSSMGSLCHELISSYVTYIVCSE